MAQLTLYGNKASPYSDRVRLALAEGNIDYKYVHIELPDKPAFFAEKVNPIGKVPAITYGGPDAPPEDPSPLAEKLAESNVILEFLADAYPDANLMPTDPIQRAKVRFFMEAVSSRLIPPFYPWLRNQPDAVENFLKAIESIQELLPPSAEYAVGESYTIADACIIPLIHRIQLCIEYDIGKFPVGDGPKFGESLKDPKFTKFNAYVKAMNNRKSSKEVFDPEFAKPIFVRFFGRA